MDMLRDEKVSDADFIKDDGLIKDSDFIIRRFIADSDDPNKIEGQISNGVLRIGNSALRYLNDGMSVYSYEMCEEATVTAKMLIDHTNPDSDGKLSSDSSKEYGLAYANVGEIRAKLGNLIRFKHNPVSDTIYPARGECHCLVGTSQKPEDKRWSNMRRQIISLFGLAPS